MPKEGKELYEFGRFRLDVTEHFLTRISGERVSLSEKAFETLCILVRNAGHLLNKNELLDQVWTDSFVEENNLDKCIYAIRRALGEKPGEQKFIETVRKHGYRFVAEVRRIGEEAEPPHQKSAVQAEPKQIPQPKFLRRVGQTDTRKAGTVTALADWRHETEKAPPENTNKHSAKLELVSANPLAASRLKYRAIVSAGIIFSAMALGFYFYTAQNKAENHKNSIAILPFKAINGGVSDEIYEIGIADSLILRLGSMKGFTVRPLNAMRKYAEVAQDPLAAGKEQQVDYVLASNYQMADGKIKITAQLFNVASGDIEETYKSEKDFSNIFAIQDAIAGELGNILLARFTATPGSNPTARRGTNNEEAYRLYLQGRNLTYNLNAANARKAVEYFEQAVRLDPNYARAFSGMAHAIIASGNLGGGLPREECPKAREAVNKALELDKNLGEGHAVTGEYKFVCEWDFSTAEKDLLRAVEFEPNSDLAHEQYASFLSARGRFEEAIVESAAALEINPSSPWILREHGRMFYLARRYDEAITQFKRANEIDGNNGMLSGWIWTAYEMKGDEARAYEWFMKSQKQTAPERLELYQNAYEAAGWQGVRQKLLEFEKLNEQKASVNYYRMARQSVMSGDKEQAFAYLNKAVEKRHGQLIMLNVEPPFDSLRDDPRFDELVRRVGLK